MGSLTVKKILFSTASEKNLGYLILRIFVGAGFMTHGYGKVFLTFPQFANYIEKLNIPLPTLSAGLAAGAEFFGGLLLVVGLCTRISALLLMITMIVAAFIALAGTPFAQRELALLYLVCTMLFVFKGAGNVSLDAWIGKTKL